MNKKQILYLDTCSLINLQNNNNAITNEIANKFIVRLSFLNKSEISIYGNERKRNQLLEFINKLNVNNFSLLDFPCNILKRFIYDFSIKKKYTCWSIPNDKNPEWNDNNNILVLNKFLNGRKNNFVVTSNNAREFIKKNKIDVNNSAIQIPLAYLNSLYENNDFLLRSFEDIFNNQQIAKINIQDKIELMKSLELICYFGLQLLGYHRLIIQKTNCSPKNNPDSIDIAHGFYLGDCDVFVTDDDPLFTLLIEFIKFKYFKDQKKVEILKLNQLIKSL